MRHEGTELAEQLQLLSDGSRREILAKACVLAARDMGDVDPLLRGLISAVGDSGSIPDVRAGEARLLAAEADDRYFTLREEGAPEAEWLIWFARARLLTAIQNFFEAKDGNTSDVLYELSHTSDDPSAILELIRSELEKTDQ